MQVDERSPGEGAALGGRGPLCRGSDRGGDPARGDDRVLDFESVALGDRRGRVRAECCECGPSVPRVVGVQADPPVHGPVEPGQRREPGAGRPTVDPQEAFAAKGDTDVWGIQFYSGYRPASCRQLGRCEQLGAHRGERQPLDVQDRVQPGVAGDPDEPGQ